MLKKRIFMIVTVVVFFTMAFLLLKENEGRTAAEEKLRQLQYKIDSMSTEKEGVIEELQTKVAQMEGELKEGEAKYFTLEQEKSAEINKLTTQAQEQTIQHEAAISQKKDEINAIEVKSKEDTERFSSHLKEKNALINDLGERLKEAAAQNAELLKKIEVLESENMAGGGKISQLESDVKRLEQQKAHLSELIKDNQKGQPTKD